LSLTTAELKTVSQNSCRSILYGFY